MVRCEMCGEEADELHTAKVSGAELDVCDNCVQFGTRLDDDDDDNETTSTKYSTDSSGSNGRKQNTDSRSNEPMPGTQRLALDYGTRIRKARQSAGYSIDELADKLNEKASHLRKVEQEERQPDNNLQATIEGFLGIDLTMSETTGRGDMDLDSNERTR